MKKSYLIVITFLAVLFSCKKNSDNVQTINGTWKLIEVKNLVSNITITKPQDEDGEVILDFSFMNGADGIFKGNTPHNTILENNFKISSDGSIEILSLNLLTKIGEPYWGNLFVKAFPDAISYDLKCNKKLVINTVKESLTFERIGN
jgi:hypothetical protein